MSWETINKKIANGETPSNNDYANAIRISIRETNERAKKEQH